MLSYTVDGPLNIYSITEHHQQVLQKRDTAQDYELNLAGVNEIDATGVQWLLWIEREQRNNQRHLILHNPSQAIQGALQQCGCEALLVGARYE